MTITFLSPDLGLETCGVIAGVVAEASDIERITESFRGLVDIRSIPESSSAIGYDVVFRQSENPQEVEVLLPHGDDPSGVHQILVSVAASPFPAIDSVTYAVLAPAFAPGGVGVDWEDVCMIFRSGTQAAIAMGESLEDKRPLYYSVSRMLSETLTWKGQIQGVMATLFVPLATGFDWTRELPKLGLVGEALGPIELRLPSAPFILGGPPVCSILVVVP